MTSEFRGAFGLLTRLPVGSAERHAGGPEGATGERPRWEDGPQPLGPPGASAEPAKAWRGPSSGMMAWFPLVGVIVGGAGLLTWVIVNEFFGATPAAVAAVLATIAVTGALHEDGLADTADGLWGGSDPSRRLEIMRDSRIGTYGVLVLAGDLLLRTVLLAPLGMPDVAKALIAGHVIARFAPLVLVAWLPAARSQGLGAGVAGGVGRKAWFVASITVAATAVVAGGTWAPLLLAVAAVPVWLVGRAASRRIGGLTGDVLGAAVLTVNLAVTAAVVALVRAGLF